MSDLPLVSCVMAAHDYGRFLPAALASALNQDYPADRLELVVVDDGSTDDTPEILDRCAAEHPGRVTVVHQGNTGFIAATSRCLELARGELIAILDADDAWLPHKTRAQVERFAANPRLGLVYGNMAVVGEDGAVTHPSLFELHATRPVRGRARGTLIGRNVATASSIMLRADLHGVYAPLPPERDIPFQDWWLAAQVSTVAEIDFLPEPCALYRRHGSNMTAEGGDPSGRVRNLRRHVRQVRSLLARTREQEVAPADLAQALVELEGCASIVQRAAGSHLATVAEVTDADRAAAQRELAAGGRDVQRLFAAARAIGHDPTCDAARERLRALIPRFDEGAGAIAAATGLPGCHRPLRLLAEADELLAVPDLCATIAAVDADGPATVLIAIDAERFDETVPGLERLLAERGLAGDDGPEMVAFPCPPAVVQQLPPEAVAGVITAHALSRRAAVLRPGGRRRAGPLPRRRNLLKFAARRPITPPRRQGVATGPHNDHQGDEECPCTCSRTPRRSTPTTTSSTRATRSASRWSGCPRATASTARPMTPPASPSARSWRPRSAASTRPSATRRTRCRWSRRPRAR